jgi:DNA-binding NarL/FixJ family response regulator/signal transduction histidine kinase
MVRFLRTAAGLAVVGRRASRPLWYVLDALLAASLLVLDLPRVWRTYPSDYVVEWQPSALAVVLVVLLTVPIAVRRLAPVPVLVVTLTAVIIYAQLPGQPEPDYLSVCVAIYTVAADVPPRVSRWCCGAAAVLLPAALALDFTWLGIFRPLVIIVLVWMLGLERRRAILDRVGATSERIQQQAREQAIRTAQQDLRRREHIARTLHDGLARSLTLMTVHAEALKTATGADPAGRLDALLHSSREALTAVHSAVTALDHGVPTDDPLSWERLLAEFRDSGLLVDIDSGLDQLSLDDVRGRCLYRVAHEGLTNALRHAGPRSSVQVRVTDDADGTTLEVTNDSGNDSGNDRSSLPPAGGFGLTSLEQDVRALSGTLEYGPLGTGWRLSARLPRVPVGDPIPVVVVDDETMIRQGLSLLLERHSDMEVVAQFADGGELLDYLGLAPRHGGRSATGRAPHLRRLVILLDLAMPNVDGFAVLTALGQLPPPDRPPVLVLTAFGGDPSVRRALDLGARGYLLKGGTADQLAQAVRAVAGGLTALSFQLSSGAVREDPAAPPATTTIRLTPRELEVLDLLGEGLSNRAIARRLGLSERTVRNHVSAVLAKLGVESRIQAALYVHGRT